MRKYLMTMLFAATMISAAPLHAEEDDVAADANVSTESSSGAENTAAASDSNLFLKNSAKQRRPLNLDIIGGITYGGTLYTGLRFGIPIVPKGFSPLNDSFDLEIASYANFNMPYQAFGGVLDNPYMVDALIGFRYSFYPTDKCTLYIRSLFGVGILPYIGGVVFSFDISVGAYWNFSKYVGMNFDIGYPGVTLGFTFKFGNLSKE